MQRRQLIQMGATGLGLTIAGVPMDIGTTNRAGAAAYHDNGASMCI